MKLLGWVIERPDNLLHVRSAELVEDQTKHPEKEMIWNPGSYQAYVQLVYICLPQSCEYG